MIHAEVYRRLQREVELQGSQRRAAAYLNISPQYLGFVLAGTRGIGPKLLRALRLKRKVTVTYEPIPEKTV